MNHLQMVHRLNPSLNPKPKTLNRVVSRLLAACQQLSQLGVGKGRLDKPSAACWAWGGGGFGFRGYPKP